MNNRRVSVTELIDWQDCHRKWAFRHDRRLEPIERPANLATGTVVHETIGAMLKMIDSGTSSDAAMAHGITFLAKRSLQREFYASDDAEAKVAKYLPGVQRALEKCPPWLLTPGWSIEDTLGISIRLMKGGGLASIELVGRPDLYRLSDDGSVVDLVEVKTTDNDPLDYLLWNPQHRYYAAMLQVKYPKAVVRFRYLCLPTQGRFKDHTPWLLTAQALANSMAVLQARCWSWASSSPWTAMLEPNEAARCKWCDFKDVCASDITGGSMEAVLTDRFRSRAKAGLDNRQGEVV